MKIIFKKYLIKIKNKKKLPILCSYKKNNNKKIIIILHEIFGLNNHIKYICKKLNKNNYITISPNLFFEIKNIKLNKNINDLRKKINNLSDKKVINNLNYLIYWIKKKFKNYKIAIIGLSWGGRIAWLYSYYNKTIKTSIILYGRINNIKNSKHPIHPINLINKIKIPALGIYAKNDKIINKKDIYNLKKNITNKKIKIIIYKNSKHNFLNKDYKNYNKYTSKKTWKKILNWFNKYIK